MKREELIKRLEQVKAIEKDKKYLADELNVLKMVSDMIDYLKQEKHKVTNLERHKEIVKQMLEKSNCYLCDYIQNIKEYKDCVGCPFRDSKSDIYECDYQKFIDWLLEEHKEPIELKRWEYDLMYGLEDSKFHNWDYLCYMKEKGYFKGITDTSMKVEDILDNCIIVSDNYEGFEDCR